MYLPTLCLYQPIQDSSISYFCKILQVACDHSILRLSCRIYVDEIFHIQIIKAMCLNFSGGLKTLAHCYVCMYVRTCVRACVCVCMMGFQHHPLQSSCQCKETISKQKNLMQMKVNTKSQLTHFDKSSTSISKDSCVACKLSLAIRTSTSSFEITKVRGQR